MYANKSKPLTVNEIFEAHKTHKENFLILDIFPDSKKQDKLRQNSLNSVQYGDVLIKKADGAVVPLTLKFIQMTTFGRIKDPKDRDYESLKLSFKKTDDNNPDSRFGEAMDLICRTFEEKVNDLSSEGKIAIKPKAKSNALKVFSVTPTFPIQYEAEDRETGQTKELENPIVWIELKTQYYKQDEKLTHFEDLYYKKDGKPVYKKDFSVNICDLSQKQDEEVERIDSRTGKKVTKRTTHIPIATDSSGETLNNCNVQEFITPGSSLSGFIEMQLTISGRAFNLKTTFKNKSNLYVFPNQNYGKQDNHELDTEEVDEMIPQNANLSSTTKNIEEDSEEEYEEEEEDDDEFSSKLDAISDD